MTSIESGQRNFWWNFVILLIAVSVAIAIVVFPPNLVPYALAVFVGLAIGISVLLRPLWLLYLVVATAALAGFLRNFDRMEVGDTSFSISGLRWAFFAAMILFILGRYLKDISIPRYYIPFLVFAAWAAIRWGAAGASMLGMKDVILYVLPPLIGLFTICVLTRIDPGGTQKLENIIMFSIFFLMGTYIVLLSTGLLELTEHGPKGILNSRIMNPRPVATYSLVVVSLALAKWSYPNSRKEMQFGRIVSFVGLGLIAFTLSRMAMGSGLWYGDNDYPWQSAIGSARPDFPGNKTESFCRPPSLF